MKHGRPHPAIEGRRALRRQLSDRQIDAILISLNHDELIDVYMGVAHDHFPALPPVRKRDLFLEVLEYALRTRYILLKVHPEAVTWRYSLLPKEIRPNICFPKTPQELVEYYRLFWPNYEDRNYEVMVMVLCEYGARIWWPTASGQPGPWFLGYPANASR